MVIEQDHSIGTQFVQQIQQETPFRAILATSLQQVRSILGHLTCDVFLLTDDTFPEEKKTWSACICFQTALSRQN